MFLTRLLTSLTALCCLGYPRKRTSSRRKRRTRVPRTLRRKVAPEGPAEAHSSPDPTLDGSVSSDQLDSTRSPLEVNSNLSHVLTTRTSADKIEPAPFEQAFYNQVESNVTSCVRTELVSTEQSTFSCSSLKGHEINCIYDSGIQLDSSQVESDEVGPRQVELEGKDVVLEDLVVAREGTTVTGYVRVRNETYEKQVVVRHTQNEWSTYQDTAAKWTASLKGGECDRFTFQLNLPTGPFTIHLAIEATQNGKTVWDNNNGRNYCIVC